MQVQDARPRPELLVDFGAGARPVGLVGKISLCQLAASAFTPFHVAKDLERFHQGSVSKAAGSFCTFLQRGMSVSKKGEGAAWLSIFQRGSRGEA